MIVSCEWRSESEARPRTRRELGTLPPNEDTDTNTLS